MSHLQARTRTSKKGLKYNLGRKGKQWISNLALEAETAATLPPGEQEYVCRPPNCTEHNETL